MSLLSPEHPLWLPEGSVRAVLALAVVAAYFAGVVTDEIALLVLAFYFAARTASNP